MKVKSWNNGSPNLKSGSGFGIRIKKADRDIFFKKNWDKVEITIENETPFTLKITASFWKTCAELRSKKLGDWFLRTGKFEWDQGLPYEYYLILVGGNNFRLALLGDESSAKKTK